MIKLVIELHYLYMISDGYSQSINIKSYQSQRHYVLSLHNGNVISLVILHRVDSLFLIDVAHLIHIPRKEGYPRGIEIANSILAQG